jgi:hypothetical protein
MKFTKKEITCFIFGLIIATTISVSAGAAFLSKNIAYNNSYTSATNVEDALNELYNEQSTCVSILNKDYDYTGSEVTYNVPRNGYYKLETWGAQGGAYKSSVVGGYGSYSVGIVSLSSGDTLYINVGGAGVGGALGQALTGGYNGGGNSKGYNNNGYDGGIAPASGGGATHIAVLTGKLSSLSSSVNAVLIVSGGGGGAGGNSQNSYNNGGAGGGYKGNNGGNFYYNSFNYYGYGADQTTGGTYSGVIISGYSGAGSFGQGGIGIAIGGGGGFYGGGSAGYSAGGGSGYIGNSLLVSSSTITKHMTCYNCQTSTDTSTMTNTTTNVSSTATTDYAKSGNGYAKITYLGTTLN